MALGQFEGDQSDLIKTLTVSFQLAAETIIDLLPEGPERDLALLHIDAASKAISAGVKRYLRR